MGGTRVRIMISMFAEESINQDAYLIFLASLVLVWSVWAGWIALERLRAAAGLWAGFAEPMGHVVVRSAPPYDWRRHNDLTPYDWRRDNG